VNFDDVRDYNGYDTGTGGIVDVEGNVIPGLENYEVAVTASTNVTLSGINAGDAIKVTVTVTNLRAAQGDTNRTITLVGWRTNPS
jgi:MSHA pilin protein MshD